MKYQEKSFTVGCTYGLDSMSKSYKVQSVSDWPEREITFLCSAGQIIKRKVEYSGENGEMLTLRTSMTHTFILRSNWLIVNKF